MAGYPETGGERLIEFEKLQDFVRSVFNNCGMSPEDSDLMAKLLVAADLRGCYSHGVIRVPDYVSKLRHQGVNPKGRPFVFKESKGAIVIDGDNSMGQISCTFAMEKTINRAKTTGIAMAAVQGSNHCGALADYSSMALDQGMIGIAGTNALPTMAPFGGKDKILGINPISLAIPAGEEFPIIYDAAFSASSHGKIRVFHQKGLKIPNHWAFDEHGNSTTDTKAALEGLLQPIGGYKGTGLALIVGLLSTMLSNASYGTDLGNMVDGPIAGQDGHFCIAINISMFVELETFTNKVDKVIQQIKESRKTEGTTAIHPPGSLEAILEMESREKGIPLNKMVIRDLLRTARAVGVYQSL